MATRNEPDRISHELTRDLAAFQLRTGSGGSKWDSLAESGSRDSDPEYSASEVDLTPGASSVRTTSISAVSQDDKDARGQPSLRSSVAAQWQEAIGSALQKCKKMVSPADYETIQGFNTLDDLLEDLLHREQLHMQRKWLPKFTVQVFPALQTLSTTASFFMGAIHSSETAVIWGILHLIMTLSVEKERNWNDFVHRLERIRCSLVIINQCTMWFEHEENEERLSVMSAAILTVFVNILDFWIEAVMWLRKYPFGSKADILPLNETFDQKMANIEYAIKHLTQVATLYHKLENRTRSQGHADLVKNVQTVAETVAFPFKCVPEAEYKGFYGRKDIFMKLNRHLDPASITETRSALIHGIGGVGKTKTTLTWAHRSQFDAVFFVQAETEDSLRASFTKIAVALHLPGASLTNDADQNLLYFQGWLGTQASRGREGRSWLMVFDNCEDIEDIAKYLPTTAGSVVITSRHPAVKLDDSLLIELKPFEKEDSIKLFKQLATWNLVEKHRSQDEEALSPLLQTVSGLPLGIKALAALMNARQKSAVDFLPFYSKHSNNLMKDAGRVTDYDKSKLRKVGDHVLYSVFQISFNSLQDESNTFIGILACISAEDIPIEMFGGFEGEEGRLHASPSFCYDEYALDKIVLELRESSLITQRGFAVAIHRIIQEAFLYYQPRAKTQEVFNAAVLLVYKAFPEQINGRPMYEQRARCEAYIQHARALASFFDPKADKVVPVKLLAPPELGELLKSCAWHLYETGQLNSTLDILRVAFLVCLDKESLLYAHLCNTASSCYFDLNDLTRGRAYAKETLDIREKSKTAKSPEEEEDIANSYNNFGNFDCAAGDYKAAMVHFGRCEEIRIRLGKGLIIPLGILHLNVGRMLCRQKLFSEASRRYQDAEKIFLEVLGTDLSTWPELSSGVSMLHGTIEADKGNSHVALRYFETSRKILEKSAPYHISLASVCYKIACEKIKLEKTQEAIEPLRKAYTIADFVGAEGEKARIMRKKAQLLVLNGFEANEEASRLKEAADCIRINLPGEMRHIFEDTDAGWNRLVCSFYR